MTPLRAANLALLILFPIAWVAPLLRAGLLPFFDLDAISVISGLRAIWDTDPLLAALIALLALVAPIAKIIALDRVLANRATQSWLPAISALGKLAMADIFLIAVYIVLAKGTGMGRLETGWGLYLFTGCVLASLAISSRAARPQKTRASGGDI